MKKYRLYMLALFLVLSCFYACSNGADESTSGGVDYHEGPPQEVESDCASVRLTAYEAGDGGWCEFSSSHDVLPDFVREGMHLAIGEPWNGGSFGGESGEACGECWEIDTIYETRIVMVNNLCPIEGNPLCSGGHFHFDLSQEAGAALGGGGLDEARAKRVPCPVTGNIHVQVNDSNEWGYLRVAFINHVIPVRSFSVRASSDGEWKPAERSGGAWHVLDGPMPDEGEGIWFQIVSAAGETVESTIVLPFQPANGSAHDLGMQFTQVYTPEETCEFTPPAAVYGDEWGGIEGVQWQPNPWGDNTSIDEVTSDCFENSASCVRIRGMAQWEGAHFYYRQEFPVDTFTGLSIQFKALSGSGELTVAPSVEGDRCTEQTVTVTADGWTEANFALSTECTGFDMLNAVTISNNSPTFEFLMDEIRFY